MDLGVTDKVRPLIAAVRAMVRDETALQVRRVLDALPEPKRKATKTRPALDLSPLMPVRRDFAFVADKTVAAADLVRAYGGSTGTTMRKVMVPSALPSFFTAARISAPAAIVGALRTRIKATGKIIATQFAIVLTITEDVVTRFQMLEDSFDVSKAART